MRPRHLFIHLAFASCLLANPAPRADITLSDGRVLKAARIISTDPAQAMILHAEGAESIPLGNLPAELQKQYGYDPAKAEAHTKKLAENAASYAEQQKQRAEDQKIEGEIHAAKMRHQAYVENTQIQGVVEIVQVLENGILAKGFCQVGPLSYVDVPRTEMGPGKNMHDAHRTVAHTVIERMDARPTISLGDPAFIACETYGLVDGQSVKVRVWPAGTYVYTNTLGARKTVKKYTATPPPISL